MDAELSSMKREYEALMQLEQKEELRKVIEVLKRKHGEPEIPAESTSEDKMNEMWRSRGIQVTNLKEQ